MPEDNLEVVRRYLVGTGAPGSWNEPRPALREWFDGFWEPNGDYYPVAKFPGARPCHGVDAIVEFFYEYLGSWDRYRVLMKDARAIGDDRVLARMHIEAEGPASGLELDGEVYHCCWLRNGRFIRVEDHLTEDGALRAMGLGDERLETA